MELILRKTITIFGSSQPKDGEEQFETAYQLGAKLAKRNFNVCTGGYQGIMKAVSKGVTENGGEAIGVTVNLWNSDPNEYLTKEVKCNTLFERIAKLVELGDAYVMLQGGTGTLLELSVVWEFINKGIIEKKPLVCHSNMWKDLVAIIDEQIEKENRETNLIKCCDSIDEIVEYLSGELKN